MKGAFEVSGTIRGGGRTPESVGSGGIVEVAGSLVVANVAVGLVGVEAELDAADVSVLVASSEVWVPDVAAVEPPDVCAAEVC